MPNKNFEIEHQYQLYLQRMQMKEMDMHPVQKLETKRAFMGGFAQLLVLMREDIADIENEDAAVLVLKDLNNQLAEFWISQIKQ